MRLIINRDGGKKIRYDLVKDLTISGMYDVTLRIEKEVKGPIFRSSLQIMTGAVIYGRKE